LKQRTIILVVVCLALAGLTAWSQSPQPGRPSSPRKLTPALPHDLDVKVFAGYSGLIPQVQQPFDKFSWETFLALNQPASVPQPNARLEPGDNVPRIWETWPTIQDVFAQGSNAAGIPTCGRGAGAARTKVLSMNAKNEHVDSTLSGFLQATGQPLIDQNLNFVLYEIHVNDAEAGYIRENGLNTYDGQVAYAKSGKRIVLPEGQIGGKVGSIEIKAAWRILDADDNAGRYYSRRATIAIPAAETMDGNPICAENVLVGLVGLHIVHKTKNFPDAIWSTFEHIDKRRTLRLAGHGHTGCPRERDLSVHDRRHPRLLDRPRPRRHMDVLPAHRLAVARRRNEEVRHSERSRQHDDGDLHPGEVLMPRLPRACEDGGRPVRGLQLRLPDGAASEGGQPRRRDHRRRLRHGQDPRSGLRGGRRLILFSIVHRLAASPDDEQVLVNSEVMNAGLTRHVAAFGAGGAVWQIG
jgi:hypothetical protein